MNKIHLKFHLRVERANSDGLYPIYLYANINGERKNFTINRAIPENAWNQKIQEIRTSYPHCH